MPLPTPNKNEKESDFMKRCMPAATKESKDNKQAVAICINQYRKKSKSLFEKADREYRASMRFDELMQKMEEATSDKKAGYPPNCNEGYVEKDDKCVPIEEETSAGYKYRDPKTDEIYEFPRKGVYTKNGRTLVPAY